ncbi:hypothetical protein ACSBR2_014867 [Camellia fascicularis]
MLALDDFWHGSVDILFFSFLFFSFLCLCWTLFLYNLLLRHPLFLCELLLLVQITIGSVQITLGVV